MDWSKKQWTRILIGLSIFDIAGQVASWYHIQDQLLSPLIPKSTVNYIGQPYMVDAIFGSFCIIVALILYFISRYTASMIVCAISLIIPPYLFYILLG
jgi:hypothetical protein